MIMTFTIDTETILPDFPLVFEDAGSGGGKRASQLKFSLTTKYQDE